MRSVTGTSDVRVDRLRGPQPPLPLPLPPGDGLRMLVQLAGHTEVLHGGGSTVSGRGAIVGFDPARIAGVQHDARSDVLVVSAPRGALPGLDDALGGVPGVLRAADSALLLIVVPFARHVADHVAGLGGPAAQQLFRGAARMIAAALLADSPAAGGAGPKTLAAVQAYIDENLGCADLTPAAVAAANFMSVRTLHSLFSGTGTSVGAWIRNRRLDACRLDLADDGCAHRTIAEIARARGLCDPAHFSRLFVRRFGVTPSAYRTGGGASQDAAAVRSGQ